MKKRVKLLFCRSVYSQSGASVTMGSLAAYLKQNGYEVKLSFLKKNELKNIKVLYEDINIYKIAIAKPTFQDIKDFLHLLKEAKQKGIFKRIFLCGPFPSLNSEDIMSKNTWLDGTIMGYPEETGLDLVNSMSSDYNNWDFHCKGGIWRNPKTKKVYSFSQRILKKSLNELPFPERDIEKGEKINYINLESRRGCCFNCSYCHIPLYYNLCNSKKMVRDPKLVVDEISKLNKNLNKTLFIFNDSCFWRNKQDDKRILEFSDEIRRRNLNINFYIYLRCNPFPDEKIIKRLAESGLVRVFLGIENISKNVQKKFNKNIKLDEISRISKLLEKYSINKHIGYVVFEPFSSLDDIKENIEFLYKINKLFRLSLLLAPLRVIPNTLFHKKLLGDNLIRPNVSYEELAYKYNFKDKKVGILFKGLKNMFLSSTEKEYSSNSKEDYYMFEYYCISGNLLKYLIKRNNPAAFKKLKAYFDNFKSYSNEANKIIYSYLKEAISLVEGGCTSEDICDPKQHREFIKNFKEILLVLKNQWEMLIKKGKEEGCHRSILELYKGSDYL